MKETTKFQIFYCKNEQIDLKYLEKQFVPSSLDADYNYNPFLIQNIQNYQPIYSLYFDSNSTNHETHGLNQNYQLIDLQTVLDTTNNSKKETHVFIKYSPLLDPIRYMIGKYDYDDNSIRTLPTYHSTELTCHKKLFTSNNASYIDGFFSFLSSKLLHTHGFQNGIDYYGTYFGIQEKFKMNISDDYEYLSESNFFLENTGKHFEVTKNMSTFQMNNNNSRCNKKKLQISQSSNLHNISVSEFEYDMLPEIETNNENMSVVFEKENNPNDGENKSESDSDTSNENNSDEEDNEDEEDNDEDDDEDDDEDNDEENDEENDDDEEEEEENIYAYINNFPVQMICLEKCDGTLDDLFEAGDVDDIQGASILFQIIMILIVYQKAFHFTHNDLHTNNIMFINTDIEYLYYKFDKIWYKVPTYGRIFKIIDFGRSIYKFQGQLLCSDSFATGGDAATQYNFEPFYNSKKPVIEPNYSFDLCRLGTSIYDFIIDDHESIQSMDELQKTIVRWCKDDLGKNVLYKKNGEERYPNFKLYKMIARTVHKHTPQKQLEYSYFNQFAFTPKNKKSITVMNIDKIPSYV